MRSPRPDSVRWPHMPGDPAGPEKEEERIERVPLYLVPKVIADHIREKREQVFRISVCRGKEHQYQIVVETFAELKQQATETTPPRPEPGAPQQKGSGTDG